MKESIQDVAMGEVVLMLPLREQNGYNVELVDIVEEKN